MSLIYFNLNIFKDSNNLRVEYSMTHQNGEEEEGGDINVRNQEMEWRQVVADVL